MFKEKLELLKKGYNEEKAKQEHYRKNPDASDSKKAGRVGGLILIVLGAVFGFATYMGYRSTGSILVIGAAATIGCIGCGFYALATGKIPQKK